MKNVIAFAALVAAFSASNAFAEPATRCNMAKCAEAVQPAKVEFVNGPAHRGGVAAPYATPDATTNGPATRPSVKAKPLEQTTGPATRPVIKATPVEASNGPAYRGGVVAPYATPYAASYGPASRFSSKLVFAAAVVGA